MAELQQSFDLSTSLVPSHGFRPDPSALFTPVLKGKAATASADATGAAESQVFSRAEQSRTLKELQQDPLYGTLWRGLTEPEPARTPVEVASDHRLAILAKKYEGAALSREDEARVAILTQRLRRLAPRVSALSWTIAEESVTRLELAADRANEIGAKYGL